MMRGLVLVPFVLAGTVLAHAQEGMIVKEANGDVAAAAERLVGLIEEGPATLVARVDHQANAKAAGMTIPAATLIIFGNPAMGTPIIQANPMAALDLPVRVLVWDDGGQTKIGYLDPQALKERYSVEGADQSFEMMATALDSMTSKAAE